MTFLPIVRRELAVAARRTATYRQRVIFAAVATATVALLFMFSPVTRLSGAKVFQFIAWAGFVLALLEGLRVGADSISLERRDGTLGLLLLTDARGSDVVVAKIVSASVQCFTTVVAMLPAFTLPLLMGGVTAGECWRIFLALLSSLALALSAGIFVSSWAMGTLSAFASALALLALIFAPAAAHYFLGSMGWLSAIDWLSGPLTMQARVPESAFLTNPHQFWRGFGGAMLVPLLLFAIAGFSLHRFPRLEPTELETAIQRWLRPRPDRCESWGGSSARANPAAWLAERTLPGLRWLWTLITMAVCACFACGYFGGRKWVYVIFGIQVAYAFLIKLWAAAVAPLSLNTSRRNGSLELLLCTPMSPRDIVKGQVDALYGYFMAPALVVSVGFAIAGLVGIGLAEGPATIGDEGSAFAFGLFWLLMFALDLHALSYAGLWYGLTSPRVDRAIAKTVWAVLLLPWVTMVVPFIGCLGMIGWPAFWIYWSSARLEKFFRTEAVKQHSATEDSGWTPWRS